MFEYFINNWHVLIGLVAILGMIAFAIYKFAGLPTSEQVYKIKKWLLYAVTSAEKELGGKTGDLKLRMVFDMFVSRFPLVAKLISFSTFSYWVDEALDEMKKLLEENSAIKTLVENK